MCKQRAFAICEHSVTKAFRTEYLPAFCVCAVGRFSVSADFNSIYAIYYSPININTEFLGSQINFQSAFSWSQQPYNTSLAGFNNADMATPQTAYALPGKTQTIPAYGGHTYSINEGFWNGGNFKSFYAVLSGYGNAQNCFITTEGQVNQCLTEGSVQVGNGAPQYSTNLYYNQSPYFYFYRETPITIKDLIRYGYFSFSLFDYPTTQLNGGVIIGYNLAMENSIAFDSPQTLYLNYGYFIPTYVAFNDNISGSSCNNYIKIYSSVSSMMPASSTNVSCFGSNEYVTLGLEGDAVYSQTTTLNVNKYTTYYHEQEGSCTSSSCTSTWNITAVDSTFNSWEGQPLYEQTGNSYFGSTSGVPSVPSIDVSNPQNYNAKNAYAIYEYITN